MESKRILLIEDEVQIRELYARTLRSEGYDVTEIGEGEAGYKEIISGKYDLVFLDIMLPELDGIEILRKVREETENPVTSKIVMLTNLDFDSVKGKADGYHADGYLVKNQIDVLHLADEVKKYIG